MQTSMERTRRRSPRSPISTLPPSSSRQVAALGIYPAVDPLASTSNILAPEIVGQRHYEVARRVQEVLQRYKELQDIIAILGLDELSEEDQVRCRGPARCRGSCRSRSSSARCSPA